MSATINWEWNSKLKEELSKRVAFESLVRGFETDSLPDDVSVESVFCLIRARSVAGETVWSTRSGGEHLSSEELLGALEGLVWSIRKDLAADWES